MSTVYVPVNSTMGVSSISLNLQLGDASDATYLGGASGASWRIKITQLECGAERNYTLLPSPGGNLNYRDTDKIAPPGCVQYYSSRHGTYSSFNYGGLYLSDLDYAICFKRDPDACAIRHTFDHFGLAALNQTDSTDVNAYYDEVCYSSQSGLVVGDYLYIPLAQINSTSTTATQFCGVTLNGYSATCE
ncbi:unnamed protein product [Timema podura]|uniref:CUB domain-containing protein n=1 Tax=Timema podura TaxID=61482 RepID=A0ABN7PDR6_TIMPD|nr:unnamed protein product [Timema podura]